MWLSKLKECRRNLKTYTYHRLPKEIAHSLIYKETHGDKWNKNNPQTYDEKIHWHMVHTYDESYSRYADKYLVRDYVKSCGYEKALIPLYGVYDSFDDIDFSVLPKEFILKANHGSGSDYYDLCLDKDKYDIEASRKKFNRVLDRKYSSGLSCEYHYEGIKPRIICEKLLVNPQADRLDDYKVVCCFGEPKAILLCSDRDKGRDYYSINWEYLGYVKEEYRSNMIHEKPAILEELLCAAAVLSKPFPLSRIDFYIVGNQLYFGEITLTPSGGNHAYLNEFGQSELGRMITSI